MEVVLKLSESVSESVAELVKNANVAISRAIKRIVHNIKLKKQCCNSPLSNTNSHVWKVLYNVHDAFALFEYFPISASMGHSLLKCLFGY